MGWNKLLSKSKFRYFHSHLGIWSKRI